MSYFRFGIHCAGVGGNYGGLGKYLDACEAAGVPCIVQAVDNAGPAYAVQQLGRPYDVVVFRLTERDGITLDTANYDADPIAFAQMRMATINRYWPPELDRAKVWTCPINEPSKEAGDVEWLAAFTLECAQIALANGWRHLAYGWSTGTPEPDFWQLPDVVDYLQLCSQHPDLLGISLHEYALGDDLQSASPWLINRFLQILTVCEDHALNYPTIIIGEFGWHEDRLPLTAAEFARQLQWQQEIYGAHDNVLGAAIWTLGQWHGTIANDLSALMPTLTALATSYEYEPPEPPDPPPPRHKAIVVKLPQDCTKTEWAMAAAIAYDWRHTMTASHDDMMTTLRGGNSESYVKFSHPERDAAAVDLVEDAGYRWERLSIKPGEPPPGFAFTHWPTPHRVVTQEFLANPDYYNQFGLPGHEGVDIRAYHGDPVYAVADGVISQVNNNPSASNYGIYIRVRHADDYETTYAHLVQTIRSLGETVQGGDIVGLADNTGNSQGSHLHLTLKKIGVVYTDRCGNTWPYNITDPTPYLATFDGVTWPGGAPGFPCPPPPPATITVDIQPYFVPQTSVGQFLVLSHLGGAWTQDQQLQRVPGGDSVVLVKGNTYERWRVTASEMQRAEDTSAGDGLAYTQNWARWLPRVVGMGDTYVNTPRVTVKRLADCSIVSDQTTTDYLTIAALHTSWQSPANPALSFQDVLEIHWRKSPGGPIQERYFIAPGLAYVAWGRGDIEAAVSELPGGRPPLPWRSWGCG